MNEGSTSSFNDFHDTGRKTKSLETQAEHNKTSLIVHELCLASQWCKVGDLWHGPAACRIVWKVTLAR